jgi:hypothetical protein
VSMTVSVQGEKRESQTDTDTDTDTSSFGTVVIISLTGGTVLEGETS